MAKFRRFEGAFSWFFIELETHSVERDICLIATAKWRNCSYNKGYIAYLLRMRETAIFPLPIWGRFQLIFFIGKAESPPYFYFRFIWPTDLESVMCWATHVDHFHQVWSWYDYPSPSYSVVGADTLCDLVTLTFRPWPLDLGQWSNMAGHVVNPSTKFEDPKPIRSWIMSYDVHHKLPLTMRLEPLLMRHITWPVRRG